MRAPGKVNAGGRAVLLRESKQGILMLRWVVLAGFARFLDARLGHSFFDDADVISAGLVGSEFVSVEGRGLLG